MSTLKDVAKLANVSTATVSRVFSNESNVKVSTAERVMQAAKELHYYPNAIGRQLRTKETKTILVVVPDITNPFFSNVLRGIEITARKNGFQALLGNMLNNADNEAKYFDFLHYKQVDGAILLTARSDRELLGRIAEKYPIVIASEYVPDSEITTVLIDNIKCAKSATDHLIRLGHERIAHISGPLNTTLGRDRLKGYQRSLSSHNLAEYKSMIIEGDFSYNSGFKITEHLLSLKTPPSAIFAANDEMAIGSIKAIKNNGLSVPHNISVVGFDDIKMASIYEPALTTISQPAFDIGVKSMELLFKLIKKEKMNQKQLLLNGKLIIRDSCGKISD